jgi:hypothetical protein
VIIAAILSFSETQWRGSTSGNIDQFVTTRTVPTDLGIISVDLILSRPEKFPVNHPSLNFDSSGMKRLSTPIGLQPSFCLKIRANQMETVILTTCAKIPSFTARHCTCLVYKGVLLRHTYRLNLISNFPNLFPTNFRGKRPTAIRYPISTHDARVTDSEFPEFFSHQTTTICVASRSTTRPRSSVACAWCPA